MKKLTSILFFSLLIVSSSFSIAGEPVPGAEVYIEQEPTGEPLTVAESLHYTNINLQKAVTALRKSCKTRRCLKLVKDLKVRSRQINTTVNHYGINKEEIK